MIDFIKIVITDFILVQELWATPFLYFRNEIDKLDSATGEIINKKTRQFEGITFKKEPHSPKNQKEGLERLIVSFKPHYWFNENKHNANNFNVTDCIKTIERFIQFFKLNPSRYGCFKIINLEYGVNFTLQGYGKDLILYDCYHSRNEFIRDRELQYSKIAYRFDKNGRANTYQQIKFYSKGFQFPNYCDKDTLRFEVRTKQSRKIRSLGISNIGDLLNHEVYGNLKQDLINSASNTLLLDRKPNTENLRKREKNLLAKYTNTGFWFEAINKNRSSAFNEKKERYFQYLDKTGYNLNRHFLNVITEKLEVLTKEE
jgi:hypothetical protein